MPIDQMPDIDPALWPTTKDLTFDPGTALRAIYRIKTRVRARWPCRPD